MTLNLKAGLDLLSRAWRAVRVSVCAGRDIARATPPACARPRYEYLWRQPQSDQKCGLCSAKLTNPADRKMGQCGPCLGNMQAGHA
jgi:hypothetical protein